MKKNIIIAAVCCTVAFVGCATRDQLNQAGTRARQTATAVAQTLPTVVDDGLALAGHIADLVENVGTVFQNTNSTVSPTK